MSRSRYQEFLDAEDSGADFGFGATTKGPEALPQADTVPAAPPELPPLDVNPSDLPKSGGGEGSARGGEFGDGEGASPPASSSMRMGLSAPSTTKDWRLKRDAVGNLGRFPRHHVGLLGTTAGSGFARCLPQPVLD